MHDRRYFHAVKRVLHCQHLTTAGTHGKSYEQAIVDCIPEDPRPDFSRASLRKSGLAGIAGRSGRSGRSGEIERERLKFPRIPIA